MEKLREYRAVALSGVAVALFLAAAYFWVGKAEETDSRYAYAEHLFREDAVNEIDIQIAEADWQDMLENPLAEEYHRADVVINGETVGNVAIRTKGNTSLTFVASSDSDRYSFKLDFDYFEDGGNYYGLKKLNLNNNYSDSSSMREYLSYKILDAMGVPVPGCSYTHITVNGEEWGLYLAVEAIDEVFLETHFADASGDLYKPDGTGADLLYRGDDISLYTGLNPKTNENGDGSAVLALMRALESGDGLEETLDVDEALRYLAVNTALANFDSYLGGTTHNYYLYEQDGVFSILPWDYNLSFGGFGGGKVDIYNPVSGMGGPGGMEGGFPDEPEGNNAPEGGFPDEAGENDPPREGFPTENQESSAKENAFPVEMAGTAEKRDVPPDADGVLPAGKEPPAEMEGAPPERGMSFNSDRRRMEPPDNMPGFGGTGEKPLVTTLLANEEYLAAYEGYLREMAEVYLSREYLAAQVEKIHDLIAPYVRQDATAFFTFEEFERACSTDPEDEYSLVYFGVNMAESILNQLAGGEPTFDTGSLKGGGMKGGRPSGGQNGEDRNGIPAFNGRNGGNRPEGRDGKNAPPGMPGMENRNQTDFREYLPEMAVCGGIFAAGLAFVLTFRRKKRLREPEKRE